MKKRQQVCDKLFCKDLLFVTLQYRPKNIKMKYIKTTQSKKEGRDVKRLKISGIKKSVVNLPKIKSNSKNTKKENSYPPISHESRNVEKIGELNKILKPKRCIVKLQKLNSLKTLNENISNPNQVRENGNRVANAQKSNPKVYQVNLDSGNIIVTRAHALGFNEPRNEKTRTDVENEKPPDEYDFDSESVESVGSDLTQNLIRQLVKTGKAKIAKYKHGVPRKKAGNKSISEVLRRLERSLLKNQTLLSDKNIYKKSMGSCEKDIERQRDFETTSAEHEIYDDSLPEVENISDRISEDNNVSSHNANTTDIKTNSTCLNPAKAIRVLEVVYLPNRATVLPPSSTLKNIGNLTSNICEPNRTLAFQKTRDARGLDITHSNCYDFLALLDGEKSISDSLREDKELESIKNASKDEKDSLHNDDTTSDSLHSDANDSVNKKVSEKKSENKGFDITRANPFDILTMLDGEKSDKGLLQEDKQLEILSVASESGSETLLEKDAEEGLNDVEIDETLNDSLFPDINIRPYFDATALRRTYSRTPKTEKRRNYFILFSDDEQEAKNKRESEYASSKHAKKLGEPTRNKMKRPRKIIKRDNAEKEKENTAPSTNMGFRNKRKAEQELELLGEATPRSSKRMKLSYASEETPLLRKSTGRGLKLKGRSLRL